MSVNRAAEMLDGDTRLQIERKFNAPLERVWRAWTAAPDMMAWLGPPGSEVYKVDADVRVGGAYTLQMRAANGDEHCLRGVYREVIERERLVFTWAWHTTPERESLVTIQFSTEGGQTRLRLMHERFADRKAAVAHGTGWTSSLDRLQECLAQEPSYPE